MNFNPLTSIRIKFTVAIIIVLISVSCRPNIPDFGGFDIVRWRADRQACDGVRMQAQDTLIAQKDKILALSESEVVSTLGAPDQQELSKRNQKFYYYYLEPHGDCATANSTDRPARMAIRFNAMGLAKEVRIEKHY